MFKFIFNNEYQCFYELKQTNGQECIELKNYYINQFN